MPENEPHHPASEPDHEKVVEFDLSNYPDRVSCNALPSLDGGVVTVEVEDAWGEKTSVEDVPESAIQRLNMPRLHPDTPDVIREPFEKGIGLAMLRCRKEEIEGEDQEKLDSATMVQVPTTSGDVEVMIRREALVRRMN